MKHICTLQKYWVMMFCTHLETLKNSKAKSIILFSTEPHALARSNHTTLLFSLFACWVWSQMKEERSVHPGRPGIPAFWQLVSMYPFAIRKLVNLLTRIEKIFPSTFSKAMLLNWLMVWEFCSLGMYIQRLTATLRKLLIKHIWSLLGPGAKADLALLTS